MRRLFLRMTWLRPALRRLRDAELAMMAASLAYYASFSLFPLLLLAIAGFGLALQQNPAFQKQILLLLDKAIDASFPASKDLLHVTLEDLRLEVLTRFKVGAGLSGLIGLVGLVWSASGFFTVLQLALRRAIPGNPRRTMIGQRVVGIASVLFLGPLALLLMLGGVLASSLQSVPWLGGVRDFFPNALVMLGAGVVFTALYRFLPENAPGWRASLVAGGFTAVMWQLAREVLGFITPLLQLEQTYGLLAGFLLLLSWLYFTMQLLLFGAVIAGLLKSQFENDGT